MGTVLAQQQKKRRDKITSPMKATSGFEPLVQLLQSRALPLGDVAWGGERETGIEPATFSLARRCSTTEPLPHMHCGCIFITTLTHGYNNTTLPLCQQFLQAIFFTGPRHNQQTL